MGYKTILLEKSLDEVIDQRKVKRHMEMMNHLTSTYENRLRQLGICPFVYALCTRLLDGVLNYFAAR